MSDLIWLEITISIIIALCVMRGFLAFVKDDLWSVEKMRRKYNDTIRDVIWRVKIHTRYRNDVDKSAASWAWLFGVDFYSLPDNPEEGFRYKQYWRDSNEKNIQTLSEIDGEVVRLYFEEKEE